jgi:mRNA interferase MazF
VVGKTRRQQWVPDRGEIIWIELNPQAGREMRDRHPLLVISERAFNARTSIVIGLPMSSAEYNADNPFAVAVGRARVAGRMKTSFVLCHQPKSFDWRVRAAAPHPLKRLSTAALEECLGILNQIMQLG